MAIFLLRAARTETALLWRCYTIILLEISRRTRWWCLKCVIVYLARDIRPFVMYYVNGKPCSDIVHHELKDVPCSLDSKNILLKQSKSSSIFCQLFHHIQSKLVYITNYFTLKTHFNTIECFSLFSFLKRMYAQKFYCIYLFIQTNTIPLC